MLGCGTGVFRVQAQEKGIVSDEAIYESLEKKISFKAGKMKFSDALEKFRSQLKLMMHVDWVRLGLISVKKDAPVSLDLNDVPARKVLGLILTEAGGSDRLQYIVEDGIVQVSTRESMSARLVTRIYDIKDLLQSRQHKPFDTNVVPATRIDANLSFPDHSGQYGGGVGMGGGLFGGVSQARQPYEEPLTNDEKLQQVMDIIKTMTPERSWDGDMGVGKIQVLGRRLIISQTHALHRDIEKLLAQIRKARAGDRMVGLDARWIVVDRKKAAALMGGDGEKVLPEITAAALEKSGAISAYEGRVTGHDGQVLHIASGEVDTYLIRFEPLVTESAVALRPIVCPVLWGAVLEASAVLSDDGNSVRVQLKSVVAGKGKVKAKPIKYLSVHGKDAPRQPDTLVDLDLPSFRMQTFETNVKVPVGKPVLIAGSTSPGKQDSPRVMYLILTVRASK
jgi:hypothetical protein